MSAPLAPGVDPILIVEDDAGTALLVQRQLREEGWDSEIVTTARGALSWLGTHRALMMLLDNSLPDMSGEELLEMEEDGRGLPPFIITTGSGSERLAVSLMKHGARDYLVKDSTFLRSLGPAVGRVMIQLETERRLAETEAALKESEARYRRITEGLTDYQYRVRMEDGRAVETTHAPGCEAVTGYTVEDFAADPFLWFTMIAPEDRDAARSRVGQILEGQQIAPFEHRIIRKDGALRWVSDTSILNRDPAGRLVAYDGVVKDITARKQAEEALRESEGRFRTLLQSVDFVAVQSYLPDGTVTFWNQSSERLYGYTAREAVGRNLLDLIVPPEMHGEVTRAIAVMNETGQVIPSAELSLKRKDGARVAVYSSHALVQVPGRLPELFCMDVDLTDRKRLEQQLHQSQKMESLGLLAGGVAHDMNNVLGAILGLASLHQELQPPDTSTHRAFSTIAKACARGGDLVRSLLGFARQDLAEEKVLDLNAILREEIRILERTTLARVRLEVDLAQDLLPVQGDASALTHAFMNLCVNAVEAMGDQGTLTLRTRNLETGWVEVQVVDTGTGMLPEVLEKALDPFFTTKVHGKGTGLGLSLVHTTVSAHRGRMELLSEPGQGTRVVLAFPSCAPAPVEPEAAPGTRSPSPAGGLQVLLVDDDELIQSSVSGILEMLGHEVVSSTCGEEALARYGQGLRPGVVLLDMNMPGMGGAETLARLRGLDPQVPVFLCTGRVDQTALALAAAHPGVTLLPKPFSMGDLKRQLDLVPRT